MNVEKEFKSNVPVLKLTGDLDYGTHTILKKAAEELFAGDWPAIVLDISAVSHIDSMGIGTLVHLWREVGQLDKELRIAGPSPNAARMIHLVNLDNRIPVFDSVEDSLADR
ncbi:MAG: STAS domain-containing protein [bacterium]